MRHNRLRARGPVSGQLLAGPGAVLLTAELGLAPALRLRIFGIDPLTCLALGLTVGGWALFWASALQLLAVLPAWLAALIFFCGLALIPLRADAERGRSNAASKGWN